MTEEQKEIRGRIPKSLKQDFEIICIKLEISQTEAIEQAVKDWIAKQWDKGCPE